jgi:hypothetical protein
VTKKTKSTIVECIFYLMAVLVINNCSTNSPSIIFSSTCKPPCWYEIEPGKTSEKDVISILNNISIVDANSILTHGNKWLIFDDIVYFTLQNKKISGEVFIINNKTAMITFYGDLNITFSDSIEEFGEPEFILNVPTYNGPPGAITNNDEIAALKPKSGIEVSYNTKDLPTVSRSELKPENMISLITYFDTALYNQLLDAGLFSMGFLNGIETQKYMVPWNGYGNIKIKYPSAIIK